MIAPNSRIFGWLIDSSAPTESGPMGATLEIQRSQQMEALEQHMMQRQQVKNKTFHKIFHKFHRNACLCQVLSICH